MSDILSRLAALPPKKRDLLLKKLERGAKDPSAPQPITRRADGSGRYPLSFGQYRMWFFDQLEPGSSRYNVPEAIRIKGPLDTVAFRRSMNELIRRHEVLRTTFSSVGGEPVQIVAASLTLRLPVVDLTALDESEREPLMLRIAVEEGQVPFTLSRGPLLRPTMIQMSDQEFVFLLTNHHIISDRWSRNLLIFELLEIYKAFSKGLPSPLPDPPLQYADYSVWQREYLRGEALEDLLSYWKKQLGGGLTMLEIPADRPRPAVRTYRGDMRNSFSGKRLGDVVRELYQSEGATLYMAMLAVWTALLHRYTGQLDIIVGLPIANRNRPELEKTIGFFVNTLAIRADLSGDPTFRELLRRIRTVTLEAYAHQDLPFEKVVEELNIERDLSYNPLFQVSLNLQNQPLPKIKVDDLVLSLIEPAWGLSVFDMTLYVWESLEWESPEGGLTTTIIFNADLFNPARVERALRHIKVLLEAAASDPDRRLSEICILTKEEREQIELWNDTETRYAADSCIHTLFEAQADANPEAPAVIFDDVQLTYGELNRRANRVARYLMSRGAEAESRVGLLLDRSVEMIVGLLGILKAGAAYVPIDSAYPEARVRHILRDAGVSMLLTSSPLISGYELNGIDAVLTDSCSEEISKESGENPDARVTAQNLAYVIYTSGSTGEPKGAMIEHGSLVNLSLALCLAIDSYSKCSPLRVGLNGPLAFDTSVKQIVQLLRGHTLVIAPQEARLDGAALLSFIRENRLDVIDCTPVQVGLMIDAGLLESTPQVSTTLLVGGEAIDQSTWSALVESESASFYNLYGPTECAVDATVCRIDKAAPRQVIGRPIANVRIRLLDSSMQPVPIGVNGELYIGGAGVGRGYLNSPELTAEKFLPDPFAKIPGARLYRSGDVARYHDDGNIEFVRRIDQQVKLRGFRIELGEIETALCRHGSVKEAVAVIREDSPGNKRLVAYVVPSAGESPNGSELRNFLKGNLPDFMLPAAFVTLDALPLTANGKIDHLSLPGPDTARFENGSGYVGPRNEIEEILAEIWVSVLSVDQVGVHNDFFDLGGHSLNATQVIARIHNAFEIQLPLRALFANRTISELALAIEEAMIREVAQVADEDAERRL
jgi:amino acid adenylation domain-containing protein